MPSLCDAGNGTQDFVHAGQALYQQSPKIGFFYLVWFVCAGPTTLKLITTGMLFFTKVRVTVKFIVFDRWPVRLPFIK